MKVRGFLVQAGLILAMLAAFAYGLLAAQLFLIGENPLDYHVDPLVVATVDHDNQFLAAPGRLSVAIPDLESPVFKLGPRELMHEIDRIALQKPRTRLAAGGPAELWATYVQRSKYMRFPDYISIVAVGLPDGASTLGIFSQSVYGARDLGVNKARVELWLNELRETVERR